MQVLNLKKALLFAIFGLFAIGSVQLLATATYKGCFNLAGGKFCGTITASRISQNPDGTHTCDPPVDIDADGLTMYSKDLITIKLLSGGGKVAAINSDDETDINFYINKEINIRSKEAVNVVIYDLTGKRIYNVTGQTSVFINKDMFANVGSYFIEILSNDKETKMIVNFVFLGDSFSINSETSGESIIIKY